MKALDARLLAALRAAAAHLPADDLARVVGAPLAIVETRLVALRGAGFEIENRPGFGVRLLAAPDRLIADDISARLGAETFVREILVFAETHSTNDVATQLGRQCAPGGVVVFAEKQTGGRGRFGRRWASAPYRGLWFSILLRPKIPLALWTRLTTWAAVSIAAALENAIGEPCAIKWPNDIFLGGKKVAGILAESGADSNGQQFAVVGIGINVNHEACDFPHELAETAGSLREITGKKIDRSLLAARVLHELDLRLSKLGDAFAELAAEAQERSALLGRWIQLREGETVIEGRAEELDADGHLLVRVGDGSLRKLTAGEVTVIAH